LIFIFFLVFSHDFIVHIDCTYIAATNTATDNVTSYVTRRIFNTRLKYSCAQRMRKIGEKI